MSIEKILDSNKLHLFRMDENEDILLTLKRIVAEKRIKNAVILSGVGSVKSFHYHVVASGENPPKEEFSQAICPSDIVNINGMVIDGRIHSHIVLSDKEKCYGGHLEQGTVVLTFAAVLMLEIDESLKGLDSIGRIDL